MKGGENREGIARRAEGGFANRKNAREIAHGFKHGEDNRISEPDRTRRGVDEGSG
jgi:hypothetical protein